jgi:PKD repeat protein
VDNTDEYEGPSQTMPRRAQTQGRGGRLLVALAVAGVCAVAASTASAVVVKVAGGQYLGITPRSGVSLPSAPRPGAQLANVAASDATLTYHGGIVLHSTRPYLVFWDPGNAISAGTRALFDRYLTDTAADVSLSDDVYGVTRQYTDSAGYAASGETYVPAQQSIVDTQPFPVTGDCTTVGGPDPTCLTDAQLQDELQRLISARGLPTGTGPDAPVYFVITPADTDVCTPDGSCAQSDFCAYHSTFSGAASEVLYAAIPLLDADKACQEDDTSALQDPNGDPADVAVDDLSHEYNESITDPQFDAWYSADQQEEADNCQMWAPAEDPVNGASPLAYAPALGGDPAAGTLFDQLIDGDRYYTQSEWSNGDGQCELAPSAGRVSPAFTASAVTVAVGGPEVFTPSAETSTNAVSSSTWNFGDGSPAAFTAGAAVSRPHVFAAPGTYSVSLTLVDDRGNLATATRTVRASVRPIAAFTQSATLAAADLTPVTFDASASHDPNPGVPITNYRWDFSGDDTTEFTTSPTVSYRFLRPGVDTVTLTVFSSDGLSGSTTSTQQIRVLVAPGVRFTFSPAYPVAGTSLAFDGSSSVDGSSAISGYRWDFADGSAGSGSRIQHRFRRPGRYLVSLTLTGTDGLTNTNSRFVTVHPIEAITQLGLNRASAGAVSLRLRVNGPGTVTVAGTRYRFKRGGSLTRRITLSAAQRRTLNRRQRLLVQVGVRFAPVTGRVSDQTVRLTLTR